MLYSGDFERDFIERPFVAGSRETTTDLIGELVAEFQRPLPHVSWLTTMPRAASIAPAMRSPGGNRKYSQTAQLVIWAGNR